MASSMTYLWLKPDSTVPKFTYEPARMVVIVEAEISDEWQARISDWIVRAGCLYMMAWGINCSSWDDSVDWANIDQFGTDSIPEASFVVTTWHDDEPLEEVFWYSKNCAIHPAVNLERTIILHISKAERREELLLAYAAA
jgi:hypothetical protein